MVLAKFDDSISSVADGGTLFGDGWPLAHDWIGRGAGINLLDEDAFNPDLEQSSECETTHMATMNNWPNQGLDIFTDGQATHTCCIYTCNEVSIITVPRDEHVLMGQWSHIALLGRTDGERAGHYQDHPRDPQAHLMCFRASVGSLTSTASRSMLAL